jgi:hypothetical protein
MAKLTGYCYVVNLSERKGRKEIHDLRVHHVNCHLMAVRHYRITGETGLKQYLKNGWNGCAFCLKKYDTDRKQKSQLVISG